MKIAVYGASGFTGGLVVAELRRRSVPAVLVGRDEERLRKRAAEYGAADVRVAGLDDPERLAAAFRGCDAVVNCAGPFSTRGEPVVRAAVAAGCQYVDTAGEQRYIKHILDSYADSSVTIVPAMADDGGPGDLIAALTAARLGDGPLDELLIADLRLPGAASRGTARSMAEVGVRSPLEYADGAWRPAEVAAGRAVLAVPGERAEVEVSAFALPGVVMAPRHLRVRRVRSAIRAEVSDLFTGLTADVVESIPEVPEEEARSTARWLMMAEATDITGNRARGWVTGTDGYRLTAVIAVEGARRLVMDGGPAGARTPAQVFDPADFLDFLTSFGVTWSVERV
ncbi:saccharopine dehydrogenase NADP-binding domain-containing protein [Nonomuraea antimicrobica]|uniref:Saccharopine dehydrogenase NADP-binding domain-containing protein n=1 Tax=Nonomuraea antimicrobica TaxID=561173 RepID=A0ABP7BBQ4_9ACTN